MIKIIWAVALGLAFVPNFVTAKTVDIVGTAKKSDKTVYIEKHKVNYSDDGRLQKAETRYESPDGKLLALLKSDFTKSISVPNHVIEDFRTGYVEGLRWEGENIVLFDQAKGEKEKTKIISEKDAEGRIFVGCQGLNYYVLDYLDKKEKLPLMALRFLIPGKLDYYDFDMEEVSSVEAETAEFEISVKNWFLRIFAPKLHAKYERKTKRLVWYKGLSNIKNDEGHNQSVEINYEYKEEANEENV